MSFSFFDHTGDIGVRVRARTLDELFRDAAAAFTDAITDPARIEPRRSVSLTLESPAADLLHLGSGQRLGDGRLPGGGERRA